MSAPGESPKPGPATPAPGPEPGPAAPAAGTNAGPKPGPASSAPGPTPNDAAAAAAAGAVDPERLRRQVKEVLDAPAPTPADRAEQMERAHALLQDALGGEGAGRG
ncbi:hypothetical protein CHAN_07620 [Corynebacterium hansenii]|nr:hypothetical protein CHAN_07620 [Corynebacterium hansenii]